ncbi:MAG: putative zinc-binding protein [Desulfurococcales archaeon]|nr:putative zinc-binding protein [Desulfurococcales archaeon]
MNVEREYTLLPSCSKYAPNLITIAACDGASSVGQLGNEVAKILAQIALQSPLNLRR